MGYFPAITLVSVFGLMPFQASSNNDEALMRELEAIKLVMSDRQSRIDKSLKDVQGSRLDKDDFVLKKMPHQQPQIRGNALKCQKTHFSWLGKEDGYEYQDCIFKLDIKSETDIRSMMVAINNRVLSGWEIDRSELSEQHNVRSEKIINKEKYRFKRKLKEALL